MNKKEILEKMDAFSQQLMMTLAELDAIKKQVQGVFEENARLRLENNQLKEQLTQLETPEVGQEKNIIRGREYLENIYNEGFHICNESYGQHRDSLEECIFCDELLNR